MRYSELAGRVAARRRFAAGRACPACRAKAPPELRAATVAALNAATVAKHRARTSEAA
jgi:hypothetical protein